MSTLTQLMDRIKSDLDLEGEINEFTDDTDLRRFFNDAIRDAEAEIHDIFEDYFLAQANLTMATDSALVDMPTDIYANKIRRLMYFPTAANQRYTVRFMRSFEEDMDIAANSDYMYRILNDVDDLAIKISLSPVSRETSTNLLCYYLRNAKVFALDGTDDSLSTDIPEFERFLIARVKMLVYEKDSDPRMQVAAADMERYRVMMISSLSRARPDDDNLITADDSFYTDFANPYDEGDY